MLNWNLLVLGMLCIASGSLQPSALS
uniref:Uncharacterized protein n=1 Tax=Moniliophthora roreri TaxID=221103 RepID=A0A0W0F124_MONRR